MMLIFLLDIMPKLRMRGVLPPLRIRLRDVDCNSASDSFTLT